MLSFLCIFGAGIFLYWRLFFNLSLFRSLSHVQIFVTPWTTVHQASLFFTISQNLLRFMSVELVILSKHLTLCCPLLLLPLVFPSVRFFVGFFPSEPALHTRWPKYLSFDFSISPSNEYSLNNEYWIEIIFQWILFPLGWTGWISLQSKGLSRVFSNTTEFKSINSSALSFLCSPNFTSIHDYWKNHTFD